MHKKKKKHWWRRKDRFEFFSSNSLFFSFSNQVKVASHWFYFPILLKKLGCYATNYDLFISSKVLAYCRMEMWLRMSSAVWPDDEIKSSRNAACQYLSDILRRISLKLVSAFLVSWRQCDQMLDYLLYLGNGNLPNSIKIAKLDSKDFQIGFKELPNTQISIKNCQNTFEILPKWRFFAKSRHTASPWLFRSENLLFCFPSRAVNVILEQ